MLKIRRLATIYFLIIVMLLSLAAGCGKKETPSNQNSNDTESGSNATVPSGTDPVTMTVWIAKTFNPDADERLAQRIKSFAETNEEVAEVKVEIFPASDGYVKWNAAIESGNVPDLSFIGSDVYYSYIQLGALLKLDDIAAEVEKDVSEMIPNVKKNLTVDGSIYALPLYNTANMLHYRTDLFEQAGIKEPPKTWTELENINKIIKEKLDVYPFGQPISNSDDSETLNLWIMRSFGGRYWDEDGNIVVNSPETINAINYIASLYKNGYTPKTSVEWDSAGNNKSYMSGQCAMALNLTTLYNSLFTDELKDNLGKNTNVIRMPKGDFDTWKNPGTIMLSIFKDAQHPELSKKMLKYAVDSDWYTEYMGMNYPVSVPVYKKTTETEKWNVGLGKELVAQSELENMFFGYPSTDMAVSRADAQACADFAFSKTLQKVILNGMSPEDAVKELEATLTKLKEEMKTIGQNK